MTTRLLEDKQKLYIRTFGCQMNVYDSGKIVRLLEDDFTAVDSADDADLIIVNTCSVREKPAQKLFSVLGEFADHKKRKPHLLIGVGGCVAQQEGQAILRRSRLVDFVFGTHNLSLIPTLIERRRSGSPPQVAIDYRDEWEELPLGLGETAVSSFVSISRGCDKRCAFCIVPTTRGKEVSRAPDEILREVRLLAARGAKEVVLLGQTVNSYGRGLSPRTSFVELLDRVSAVDGIVRVRFTSPHPQDMGADLIEYAAGNPRICRHMHVPLQSGSDVVLGAMRRNYTRARYLDIVRRMKAAMPEVALTTDIIVGFPGENEVDFEDTLAVMREAEFDSSFSFMFSPRPGTAAEALPGRVAEEVALARLQRLQALQAEITGRRLAAWVGKRCEVLIEGVGASDPERLRGRNSQNIVVNLLDPAPGVGPGALIEVEIAECGKHTLKGRMLAC